MNILFLVGRIILGGYFLNSGINHFKNLGMLTGYAGSKGVPSPKLAVSVTGLMMILGGLGVILGVYVQIALTLLAVFLAFVSPMMHKFWTVADPMQKMGEQINFMKNMALLGAVFMMFALATPWAMSLAF